ncbi:MAG: LacI family DNA-binding transcriptional regulator [Pseudomonadota bacterium]
MRTERTIGTIRQVADATGVSVATVSRVVNGSGKVSAKTVERVRQACLDLNYVPNSAAKALTTKRSRTIGVIVPTLAHSIFATFLGELEAVCSKLNYSVVIALSGGNPEQESRRAKELLAMGAEAFALIGAQRDPELIALLNLREVPFVRTSIWRTKDGIPTIGYDNEPLAKQAMEYLVAKGHRRVAVLHGPQHDNDRTRLRLRGISSFAHEHADLTITTHGGSLDEAGGVMALRDAMEQEHKPTAVLCLSDVLALGALFEAPRLGLKIPADLSIMGFDDLAWSSFTDPPLTTMALPTLKMGRLVANQLAAFLDDGEPLKSVCLNAQIIERKSVVAPSD